MGDNDQNIFENKLLDLINEQESTENYKMLELDESVLKSLNENEVFIIDQRNINERLTCIYYWF